MTRYVHGWAVAWFGLCTSECAKKYLFAFIYILFKLETHPRTDHYNALCRSD